MLVALQQSKRINAKYAERGLPYICPLCERTVILKQGRKVVAHFAHEPFLECSWGTGETAAHLAVKQLILDTLQSRGIRAEVEYMVRGLPGDRRADVMLWSPHDGRQIAIEMQHSMISVDEIKARIAAYHNAGIVQLWIPFVRNLDDAKEDSDGFLFIERYSARPYEKWYHKIMESLWLYNPQDQTFWWGTFRPHMLFFEGYEDYPPCEYPSKRWRELTLSGPHSFNALRLVVCGKFATLVEA